MPPPPPGQGPWPPQGGMYGPGPGGFGGPPGAPYPPPPMGGPPFQQNGSPMVQRQAPGGAAPPPPAQQSGAPPSGPKAQQPAEGTPATAGSAFKAAPSASTPAGKPAAPSSPQAPAGPRPQGTFSSVAAGAAKSPPAPAGGATVPQIALKPLPNAPTTAGAALLPNAAQTNLDKIERALGEMSVSRGGRGPAALNASSRQPSSSNAPAGGNAALAQARGQRPPRGGQQQQQHQYQHQQPSQSTGVAVPETEFDFEAGNKKFDKASVAKEAGEVLVESDSDESSDDEQATGGAKDRRISTASGEPAKQQFYNKSTSFFDSISSDLRPDFAGTARGGRPPPRGSNVVRGRAWRDEERQTNLQTFGESGQALSGGGGFGGGGRGRGPRNGGGGGGGRPRNNRGQGGQGQQQQQQQFSQGGDVRHSPSHLSNSEVDRLTAGRCLASSTALLRQLGVACRAFQRCSLPPFPLGLPFGHRLGHRRSCAFAKRQCCLERPPSAARA